MVSGVKGCPRRTSSHQRVLTLFALKNGVAGSDIFERFRQATGLEEKPESTQVSTLMYAMGDEVEDIILSFNLTEEDSKKYSIVKDKFESYFVKRKNINY